MPRAFRRCQTPQAGLRPALRHLLAGALAKGRSGPRYFAQLQRVGEACTRCLFRQVVGKVIPTLRVAVQGWNAEPQLATWVC